MLIKTSVVDVCKSNRSMVCCRSSQMYGLISERRRLVTLTHDAQVLANRPTVTKKINIEGREKHAGHFAFLRSEQ